MALFILTLASGCSPEPEKIYVERKADGTLQEVKPPTTKPAPITIRVPDRQGIFRGCGWDKGEHSSGDPVWGVCAFESPDGTVRFVPTGRIQFGDLSRLVIVRTP